MTQELKIGERAPDFHTVAVGGEFGDGREVSLGDFRGTPLVLYFYPKDDTPGCTAQACDLRDHWAGIKKLAKLFGVSVDPAASHTSLGREYCASSTGSLLLEPSPYS